jgi:hypothetical protein
MDEYPQTGAPPAGCDRIIVPTNGGFLPGVGLFAGGVVLDVQPGALGSNYPTLIAQHADVPSAISADRAASRLPALAAPLPAPPDLGANS